jgi:hypothetical protein
VEGIAGTEDGIGVEDMIVENVVVVKKLEVESMVRMNSLTRGYEDCDSSQG